MALRPAFLSGMTLPMPIPEHFSNKEPEFSIYNGATIRFLKEKPNAPITPGHEAPKTARGVAPSVRRSSSLFRGNVAELCGQSWSSQERQRSAQIKLRAGSFTSPNLNSEAREWPEDKSHSFWLRRASRCPEVATSPQVACIPGDILEIVRSSEKDRFELQQSGRRSTSELLRGILAVMWTRVRHINLSTLLMSQSC